MYLTASKANNGSETYIIVHNINTLSKVLTGNLFKMTWTNSKRLKLAFCTVLVPKNEYACVF